MSPEHGLLAPAVALPEFLGQAAPTAMPDAIAHAAMTPTITLRLDRRLEPSWPS
jgi:hypothetical protein